MLLLTGATGFIGRAIAVRVRATGRPLAVLARGRDGLDAHARVAAALGEADVGQAFHNPYERAKLRAEEAVRAAGAACGVDVRVLRPSIVVGAAPATAGGNPSNLFFAFIRLAAALAQWPGAAEARLRVAGAPDAPFNLVPLEYVADATLALAEHPDAAGRPFHLVVRDAPCQAAMRDILAARLGLA